MSVNGPHRFIRVENGFTPYVDYQECGGGEIGYVDLDCRSAISANGQLIMRKLFGCTEGVTQGAKIYSAVWNCVIKAITEIACFRPMAMNCDSGIITGNGWSDSLGRGVWEQFNGTRDIFGK